eukprot:PhM_4_TR15921/c0_g1_i1/m.40476
MYPNRRPPSPTNRTTPRREMGYAAPTAASAAMFGSNSAKYPTQRRASSPTAGSSRPSTPRRVGSMPSSSAQRHASPAPSVSSIAPSVTRSTTNTFMPPQQQEYRPRAPDPIEGRVEIGLPQDVNETHLVAQIARSLSVVTGDIEVVGTQRGALCFDFRLRHPTRSVSTSEDLAIALSQDPQLREALTQVVCYTRGETFAFSVHSNLTPEVSYKLLSLGLFGVFDRAGTNIAQLVRDEQEGTVTESNIEEHLARSIYPAIFQENNALQKELEELKSEISHASASLQRHHSKSALDV